MATNFSPCKGPYVLNQFPSNVMFGMNGFHVSASGAIQGHHGPLVTCTVTTACENKQNQGIEIATLSFFIENICNCYIVLLAQLYTKLCRLAE